MSVEDRVSGLASGLLVAGMATCLAVTAVRFGEQLVPGWRGSHILPVAFLAAVEALVARRAVDRLRFLSREWLVFRLTEWVFLLVALKGFLYVVGGIEQLWLDLPRWGEDFAHSFFDGEYLAAAAIMIVAWAVSDRFAEDLLELKTDEPRLELERAAGMPGNRTAAQQRIAGRMFAVGAAMILLAGLARLDVGPLALRLPAAAGSAQNIVVYFLLGLLLLSQGQLSILRASWSWQRIDVAPGLVPSWGVLSVLFLAGVAALASLLPTAYSADLLATLGYGIQLLLALFFLVTVVLQVLLVLPIVWLGRLLGLDMPPLRLPQSPGLPPAAFGPAGGGPDWIQVLRSLLFWSVFLAVVGYSVVHFVKQRQSAVEALVRLPVVRWLATIWRRIRAEWLGPLRRRLRERQVRTARRQSSGATVPAAGRPGWRFVRLGGLEPRELVLYFYLATVRRAAQSGLARRPGQTPHEYAYRLSEALPEAGPDVESLTAAFVEARYSRHPVARGKAEAVRRNWERVKAVLVRRRTSQRSNG